MERSNLVFGEFVRSIRADHRIGLRQFCQKTGIDPSNWSKIERGINAPPKDERVLTFYAESLGLQKDTQDWQNFFDLAATAKGLLPSDFREQDFVAKLPAFFRTMRTHDITPDELDRIIQFVKRDYGVEEDKGSEY